MTRHEDDDVPKGRGGQLAVCTPDTSSDEIGVSYDVEEGRRARRK